MILNVFISQPMHGLTNDEIRFRRNDIRTKIADNPKCWMKCLERVVGSPYAPSILDGKREINVVNPVEREAPENAGQIWCLGQDIADMEKANLVIFASGHREAHDCRVERNVVEEYDIPFLYEAELDYCF